MVGSMKAFYVDLLALMPGGGGAGAGGHPVFAAEVDNQ